METKQLAQETRKLHQCRYFVIRKFFFGNIVNFWAGLSLGNK